MPLFKNKKAILASFVFTGVAFVSQTVHAETLMEALGETYLNNATLNAARAKTRAGDEDIAIARSGYLPSINATGTYMQGWQLKSAMNTETLGLQIKLSQNIFNGFQTWNGVAGAKAAARAQHENLRNTEQNQLSQAVEAYMRVYTSRNIAEYRRVNLAALEEQVRANKAKLNVGEGTRTDLAQAEASRARAMSELSQARANVKVAEALYRQVVGVEPGQLVEPPLASDLPKTLDEAYKIALMQHPAILAAKYVLDSSDFNVKGQLGALAPNVNLSISSGYASVYKGVGESGGSNSINASLTMPLFTGGANFAKIRKAKEQQGDARIQVDLYEDQVRQALEASWANLSGFRAAVSAFRDSVRAAKIAFTGRVHENRVGQATTLDVLNSRSQLIDMEVSLATAEKNLVVASYNVKAAIGQLTAESLGLNVEHYDAEKTYKAADSIYNILNVPFTLDAR